MTRKSPTMLVIALILTNVSWGQPTSAPEIPYMPVLTCRTVQFQSEDGKPVAHMPAHLKSERTKITGRTGLGIEEVTTFKVLKKLKTDADGKIQLPELKPDTNYLYHLELLKSNKLTIAVSKLGDCTQAFVLKDKNFIFEIGPTAPKKTVDNK